MLLFLVLAVIATRPLAFHLSSATLPGPDPIIDLWTIHWLTGHALEPSRLFGGNIFDPSPHAVLHSDLSLGTAVLLLPARLFVRDPVPLYNLGLLLALAFGGWAFHALVRELTGSLWAGILSGVLAAFGSHQLHHVYHLNLLSLGWLGLFLLGLERLRARPGAGAALLAGVSFALNVLSSGYYAVAAVLLALLFALRHARALVGRRALVALPAAVAVAGLLVWPYTRTVLELRADGGWRRPLGLAVRMAFDPGRDLTSRSYLWAPLLGEQGERLFPGLLPLVLAVLAFTRRRRESAFPLAALLLLLAVSLGPRLEVFGRTCELPYRWLIAVPPFDSMRHPYTFAAVATFMLAVLAGIGFASLRPAARRWAGPAVVLAAFVETLGAGPELRAVPAGLPPAYSDLLARPPGVILELPLTAPDTLLWAARHGMPVANGIGAFSPPQTLRLANRLQLDWLEWPPETLDGTPPLALLRDYFRVRYVIVPAGRGPLMQRLARACDASRAFAFLAEFKDGRRLYELRLEGGSGL